MKTTNLMLIVIIFAITTVGMAQSETPSETAPNSDPQSIAINFRAALQNRGMVYAMRTQLTPQFLQLEKPLYTVPVKFNHKLVYIVGTLKEWTGFFNIHSDDNPAIDGDHKMHLKQAILDARLVRAMHEQLSPSILRDEKPVYTVRVKYNNTTVFVFGNYSEWKRFFRTDINVDPRDT